MIARRVTHGIVPDGFQHASKRSSSETETFQSSLTAYTEYRFSSVDRIFEPTHSWIVRLSTAKCASVVEGKYNHCIGKDHLVGTNATNDVLLSRS